jgi:hypothetical protein
LWKQKKRDNGRASLLEKRKRAKFGALTLVQWNGLHKISKLLCPLAIQQPIGGFPIPNHGNKTQSRD